MWMGPTCHWLTRHPPLPPAALPLLVRRPCAPDLGDFLPGGAEGDREGLCYLRGADGEGGSPQLHQQGGEGAKPTAGSPHLRPSPLGHWVWGTVDGAAQSYLGVFLVGTPRPGALSSFRGGWAPPSQGRP